MNNVSSIHLFPATKGNVDLFDDFFASGMEESISPFLTPTSRKWGHNLTLKASIFAAFLLLIAFLYSTTSPAIFAISLTLSYFFAGVPALISAIDDLLDFQVNIDVLMTLAAFLSILIGSGMEGALLLVLFSFSGAMEAKTRAKANSAIRSLKNLAPTRALVISAENKITVRAVADIKPGTKIYVQAGEVVPLDGVVIAGASFVNLVHLTGESKPQAMEVGSIIVAGARTMEGALTIEVSHTSTDSTIAKIIELVIRAEQAKPKFERFIDKISPLYAKGIILFAFFFALILPFVTAIPFLGTGGSIYRGLTFLIAASPCALVIALPIAYLSAISVCAKQGILLKGGVVLDALTKCRMIAFDKTGTLTTGNLTCLEIKALDGGDEKVALQLAYAMEQGTRHPIGKAIVAFAKAQGLSPLSITDIKTIPGYGLEAYYQGQKVLLGNKALLGDGKIDIPEDSEIVTFLRLNNSLFLFRFYDEPRLGIKSVIQDLKRKWNYRILMLTGDHAASANKVASEIGITEIHADLRPEDKLSIITELAKKENLAMVGDGINDAPPLPARLLEFRWARRAALPPSMLLMLFFCKTTSNS